MKEKMNERNIEIGRDDYYVKVTWQAGKETDIKIYAKLTSKDKEKYKKKFKTRTKTAGTLQELEEKIFEAVGAAKKQLKNKPRTASNKAKDAMDIENHPLIKALKVVVSLSRTLFPEWTPDVFHEYFTYMINSAIPMLINIQGKEDFDLGEFKDYIRGKIADNKKTIPRADNINSRLNRRLKQINKIYKAARDIDPSLPDLDFGVEGGNLSESGREQIKRLPTEVIRNYRRICLKMLEKGENLKMVRAAVVMEAAGTRTGEAAGIIGTEMIDFIVGMVLKILYQDKKGVRGPLKNKKSYRNVTVDYYARCTLKKLNEKIGKEDKKKSPVDKNELAAFVVDLLRKSGLTPELEAELKREMNKDPDYDPQESEEVNLTSYVMRRNRASVWTDCCGYTEAEVDAFLGHDTEKGNLLRKKTLTQEFFDYISKKNELFCPLPEFSLHPGINPIHIANDERITLTPYHQYRIVNDSDKAITVALNAVSAEPGENIIITSNAESQNEVRPYTDGQDVYKRRKDYIIGHVIDEIENGGDT